MKPMKLLRVLVSLNAVALAAAAQAQDVQREVRVTATVANVRSTPSPAGKVLFQLKKDETARLIQTAGDWHQIEAAGGRRGYVLGTLVKVLEPPAPPPPAAPEPPPPAPAPGPVTIDHKEIACLVAEQYPKLDACFAPEDNVGRAQIHFRALDTEPWHSVELIKDGPCFSAYLPKPMRNTKQVQYYVDVVDRAFVEKQQPDTAPQGAYRARVVRKESECGGLARLAYAVGKVAKPIVVGVARTAAGVADATALGTVGQLLLVGFRPEGVILAATGAAPGAAAGASAGAGGGGSGGAAGGAGGAGAGGSIGIGTIAAVGGGLAVAGVAVAAASGGGDDSSNGGNGGNGVSPTTPPAQVNLSGNWTANMTLTYRITGFSGTFTCNYTQMQFAITHSGGSLTGNANLPRVECDIPGAEPIASAGGSAPFTGTASGGQVRMSFPDAEGDCPPFVLDGTYTSNSMSGTSAWTCTVEGLTLQANSTWNASR